MPLRPPVENLCERICNFGVAGVGKSFDFYTIPRLATRTGSDARFYVIDTDMSAEMMLSDPAFDEIDRMNVVIEHVFDWDTLMAAMTKFQGEWNNKTHQYEGGVIGANDWLCIDMLSNAWSWAQDWYTQNMFGMDYADYFLEQRRKKGKSMGGNAFDNNDDSWQHISRQYARLKTRILTGPGHIFAIANQKAIPPNADKMQRVEFGPIGFLPGGHKQDSHLYHACFHKTVGRVDGEDEYLVSSAKNRSRPKLESVVCKDFAVKVLVGNRGWKLA